MTLVVERHYWSSLDLDRILFTCMTTPSTSGTFLVYSQWIMGTSHISIDAELNTHRKITICYHCPGTCDDVHTIILFYYLNYHIRYLNFLVLFNSCDCFQNLAIFIRALSSFVLIILCLHSNYQGQENMRQRCARIVFFDWKRAKKNYRRTYKS